MKQMLTISLLLIGIMGWSQEIYVHGTNNEVKNYRKFIKNQYEKEVNEDPGKKYSLNIEFKRRTMLIDVKLFKDPSNSLSDSAAYTICNSYVDSEPKEVRKNFRKKLRIRHIQVSLFDMNGALKGINKCKIE